MAAALPACGGVVIISENSTPGFCCNSGVGYSSWIQSVTYTNVTITAQLVGDKGAQTGTAYLMNQVGPGTTAANEVAAAFDIADGIPASVPFTLFSGLTLGPGTYFLVINPTSPSLQWDFGLTLPITTLGTGVTTGAQPDQISSLLDPFPPATVFNQPGQHIFSVTGDLVGVAGTPEPASAAIVLAGLCGIGLVRRRRYARREA